MNSPLVYDTMTRAEREAFILPRWMNGESASDIAALLWGATRNAIIGVVHRSAQFRAFKANLPKSKSNTPAQQFGGRRTTPKAPPKHKDPNRKPTPKPGAMKFTKPKIPPTMPADPVDFINTYRPALPGTTPVGILDLPSREFGACRFPVVAKGLYCGVECGQDRYCPDHFALMFNKPVTTPEDAARARARYKAKREASLLGLADAE
jgi:hypothetical protein